MNLSQLRAFVEVTRTHSYAEAAERLHLSQPALSIAIKKLESSLGGQLLSRTTRRVQLTPEGEAFLPQARRLLQDWQAVVSDAKSRFSLSKGSLSIASMPSFASSMLASILANFHQAYPNINVRISDVVMEAAIEQVLSDRAELAFVFRPPRLDALQFQPLFEDEFVLVLPKAHPLDEVARPGWQDIAGYPFVAMNVGSAIRHWVDGELQQLDLALNVVCEASQLATLGELVAAGLGIAIVPGLCQQQMHAKDLVCRPFEGHGLIRSVGVVHAAHGQLSQPAGQLLAQLAQRSW